MKISSCLSPLDRISVICFKCCPYLRSFLMEMIRAIWSSGCVHSEWKKACTVLIHKKGDPNNPSNFRPIALQSVGLKIFTSCLRDSIFKFLKINGFTETKTEKGFTHKVSALFFWQFLFFFVFSFCHFLGSLLVGAHHKVEVSFCEVNVSLMIYHFLMLSGVLRSPHQHVCSHYECSTPKRIVIFQVLPAHLYF